MNEPTPPNRCRIVLIAPPGGPLADFDRRFADALAGGDVASILLPAYDLDEAAFQAFAERVVPIAQDKRRRCGHRRRFADRRTRACRRHPCRRPQGAARRRDRSDAGQDDGRRRRRQDARRRAGARRGAPRLSVLRPLRLRQHAGSASAQPQSRPLVGGDDRDPLHRARRQRDRVGRAVAATGAEFVALSSAVFADGIDAAAAIARANALLDETAPRFED